MHVYVRICIVCVSICVCLYLCGGADLAWMMCFGIMVVSGCREYVTEPVDVVLVVTGRVLYVVGGPLHVCTVLWWWLRWASFSVDCSG